MNVSMFEANIRIVGGLLSAFALSGDGRFVSKAYDMASRFLANFETVFPDNSVDLMKRLTMSDAQIRATPKAFEGERAVNIAQAGTLSLEFAYLSHIIKDPVFKERALGVIEALSQMSTTKPGLYPITIFPHLKAQPDDFYTVGGMGDSFYEYLFKYWVMTNKKDEMHLKMWNAAVNGIKEHLIQVRNRRSYIVQLHRGEPEPVMEHLACYLPGTLALAAYHQGNDDLLALAADLTDTCYQMYHRQAKGISPEKCKVPGLEPVEDQKHYLLRPEVVESIFLMWRVTRDIKYRQWGYEIALAIEKHCKISGGGYAGLADVSNTNNLAFNDRQESFFLAETLKYLFLLFGPDDVLPIDKWIFNTEAHPLPIIFH